MLNRKTVGVLAVALLSCTTAFAQSGGQKWTRTTDQEKTAVTLVGCVQKESDYRRQHDTGEGGVLGMGGGSGDEFVLINAFVIQPGQAIDPSMGTCEGTSGRSYELTGSREDALEPFIGQRIEISGMLKKAALEKNAAGEVRTEGGFDVLGRDLHLLEVNVESFRQPLFLQAAAPPVRAPAREPEPAPVATSGLEIPAPQIARAPVELPRTASPVALIGLLGLLSFGGGLALGALRRG